jgi:hypothetical protein
VERETNLGILMVRSTIKTPKFAGLQDSAEQLLYDLDSLFRFILINPYCEELHNCFFTTLSDRAIMKITSRVSIAALAANTTHSGSLEIATDNQRILRCKRVKTRSHPKIWGLAQ